MKPQKNKLQSHLMLSLAPAFLVLSLTAAPYDGHWRTKHTDPDQASHYEQTGQGTYNYFYVAEDWVGSGSTNQDVITANAAAQEYAAKTKATDWEKI